MKNRENKNDLGGKVNSIRKAREKICSFVKDRGSELVKNKEEMRIM